MISASLEHSRGRTNRILCSAMGLSLGLLSAYPAMSEEARADCRCRAPGGEMRELGTVECVDIVGTKSLVRCEMSTNTPFWKAVEGIEGCPDA